MTAISGVPQGDPFSPLLFHIFKGSFLESSNLHLDNPHHGEACCFADDVRLLALTLKTLQSLFSSFESLDRQVGLSRNTEKSHTLSKRSIELGHGGDILRGSESPKYSEVTMGVSGTRAASLRAGVHTALGTLHELDRATMNWNSDYNTRRALVKTFVYSQRDYLLYLQPMSPPLTLAPDRPVQAYASWILRTSVPDLQKAGGAWLARLSTFLLRRTKQGYRALAKLQARVLDVAASSRDTRNWGILKNHEFLREAPRELERMQQKADSHYTSHTRISVAEEQHYRSMNTGILRRIPSTSPTPALSTSLSPSAKRTSARSYLCLLRPTASFKR